MAAGLRVRIAWIAALLCVPFSSCLSLPRLNSACLPLEDPRRSLDLRTRAGQVHLIHDADFAEELAVRHADATRGKRSGHFVGDAEYHRTRLSCLNSLVDTIARTHGIPSDDVRAAVGRRTLTADILVFSTCLALFALLIAPLAQKVSSRFAADGPQVQLVALTLSSLGAGIAGVWLGHLWTGANEMARLGTTHMSYRGLRGGPWSHYSATLFAGSLIVFCVLACAALRSSDRR
jgi:hypothetical protein